MVLILLFGVWDWPFDYDVYDTRTRGKKGPWAVSSRMDRERKETGTITPFSRGIF